MRYRIYHSGKIHDPMDLDYIADQEWFSPAILVCEESKSGMNASDWKKAGAVPEFAPACQSIMRQSSPDALPIGQMRGEERPNSDQAAGANTARRRCSARGG